MEPFEWSQGQFWLQGQLQLQLRNFGPGGLMSQILIGHSHFRAYGIKIQEPVWQGREG